MTPNADLQRVIEEAIAVCKTCGMPVRVIFENGEIARTFSVCGHITKLPPDDSSEAS